MILQAEKVRFYFGYWPDFSDGKIVLFSYEARSVIVISVSYADADRNKCAVVRMRFIGVTEVSLSELRTENVIDALQISDGNPVTVRIESAYGLEGSFNCEAVEVQEVLPNVAFERDA